MAIRFDIGTVEKAERLPDGRLRAPARLTRTGVFRYRNMDGSERREYRPADEVFKRDSLHTFTDSVVTAGHPPEMITARNARTYGVGQISGAPRVDGSHVAATIVVNDADTIDRMERGEMVELSCGYECDLRHESGISPQGERYDAIQTNIRGNHVALVPAGRAGPTARVRMDAAQNDAAEMVAHQEQSMTVEEMQTALATEKARADELQVRLDAMPPALAKAAKAKSGEGDDEEGDDEEGDDKPAFLKKKLAKADAKIVSLEADLVTAKNEARDQRLRADAAEKARTDAESASKAEARARVELEDKARAVLGAEFKADADDRTLMVAVVKKVDGEDVAADASMDFVRGMYAGATKRYTAGANALAGLRAATQTERADASIPDEAAAARRMNEHSANAWKSKEI